MPEPTINNDALNEAAKLLYDTAYLKGYQQGDEDGTRRLMASVRVSMFAIAAQQVEQAIDLHAALPKQAVTSALIASRLLGSVPGGTGAAGMQLSAAFLNGYESVDDAALIRAHQTLLQLHREAEAAL